MTHRLPAIGGGNWKNGGTIVEGGSTGEDAGGRDILATTFSPARKGELDELMQFDTVVTVM